MAVNAVKILYIRRGGLPDQASGRLQDIPGKPLQAAVYPFRIRRLQLLGILYRKQETGEILPGIAPVEIDQHCLSLTLQRLCGLCIVRHIQDALPRFYIYLYLF